MNDLEENMKSSLVKGTEDTKIADLIESDEVKILCVFLMVVYKTRITTEYSLCISS